MRDDLAFEIAFRKTLGCEELTAVQFAARFAALGYSLDRTMDCRAPAKYLAIGRIYPSCTTGLKEADTGLSAFNYAARRDASFKAMQELRGNIFAVSRGAILEV
jgi:hypothetical protein